MFTLGPSQFLHQEREWYGTYNRDTVFAEAKWNICSLEKLIIRHMPEIQMCFTMECTITDEMS